MLSFQCFHEGSKPIRMHYRVRIEKRDKFRALRQRMFNACIHASRKSPIFFFINHYRVQHCFAYQFWTAIGRSIVHKNKLRPAGGILHCLKACKKLWKELGAIIGDDDHSDAGHTLCKILNTKY